MNEKNRVLAATSIYHAINDGSVSVIPILFPIFKDLFGLTYTQVGVVTGTGLLVTLGGQLYIGRVSDGKNFSTLLSTGILITSAALLLLTQSYDFISLLILIILLRIGLSFFHPIGVGWISRTFKTERLDWAMGIQSGFADIGAFLAIATTLYIAEQTTWQLPLFLWAILGILGLFVAIAFTRKLHHTITTVPNSNQQQNIRETLAEWHQILKNIKLLVPAFMLSGAAWGTTLTYLPLLLDERTSLSLSVIGILAALWIGVGSIASFFYGSICERLKRKNVIILAYFTMGFMGLLLTFIVNVYALILIMMLLGLASFLTFPALFSFVSEVTHESKEGHTFGLMFTLQLGTGTALLFISGALADIIGIWIPFGILGVFSLVVALLLLTNYRKPFANIR